MKPLPEVGSVTTRGPDLTAPSLSAASRVTLPDAVADRIRDAILEDELAPGQHLREEELSEQLQVSRGPVRAAFLLLEQEGLVRLSRHRGASVVELSADDLGEIYSLRTTIEELAVRLAVRRHQADDVVEMQSSLAEMKTALRRRTTEQHAARLDVEFHDTLFKSAHHDRLYRCWAGIRMQVYWFLCRRNTASPDWRITTLDGHIEILRLVQSQDEEAAVKSVQDHIRGAYDRIMANLDLADAQVDRPEPRP